MSNPTGEKTIDRATLKRYISEGLTLTEMSERFQKEFGVRRARTSFSAAMQRFNLKSPHPKTRHKATLPWRVKSEHGMAYEARMLRLLGRRKANLPLSQADTTRLDGFLRELERDHKVVHYDPLTPQGFWFVEKLPGDNGYIRVPTDVQA